MMDENINETQPTQISPPLDEDATKDVAIPSKPSDEKSKRRSWLLRSGLIVLGFLLIIGMSGFLGYTRGIKQRTDLEATQLSQIVEEQFELGVQDMENGRHEIARQRFEYILSLDPTYPGVTDKLTEVLLVLNATATPTPEPTPTPTPIITPVENGNAEELFNQAEAHLANEEWSLAIETLEELRKQDLEYRSVDIDGMLYLALRQRGVRKITEGQLEGGIYDLTLAERFGILDTEADSWRTWARYYITGASFWEVNWPQAIYYFEQVASMTPNLHNGSGWTASKRYLDAIIGYAEMLESQEKWCEVDDVYGQAYEYTGDPIYEELIAEAQEKCK